MPLPPNTLLLSQVAVNSPNGLTPLPAASAEDGNPLNNDLANLETLCVRHHREAGGGRATVETAGRVHPPPGFREENVAEATGKTESAGEGEVFLA